MKQRIPLITAFCLLVLMLPMTVSVYGQGRSAAIDLSVTELIFSGIKSTTVLPTTSVSITNAGDTDLTITGLSLTGNFPNHYRLVTPSVLPSVILPGDSLLLEVGFNPLVTPVGIVNAILQIESNDPVTPVMQIPLYGLVANGLEGSNEPTLNNAVKTLGININVGFTTLTCGISANACAPLLGEEVGLPVFQKAGAGMVTLTAVGRYSPDLAVKYGYYMAGDPLAISQIGTIARDSTYPAYDPPNYQRLNPSLNLGSLTSFDPGASSFGIYVQGLMGRFTYSEDNLNAAILNAPTIHAVRIYPVRNRAGTLVLNSYLLVFEDAANGDYQDYMFVLSNVEGSISSTPTFTSTSTLLPPTATNTNTPLPPTATSTATPVPATATNTSIPSTVTPTGTVLPSAGVISFTLINAVTDQAVRMLVNGDVIDISQPGESKFNIRINTNPATVGSVVIDLDGTINYRLRNDAPYAVAGVSGTDYLSWVINTGAHTLTATAYSAKNAGGNVLGSPVTINFTIVTGGSSTFTPTITPVSPTATKTLIPSTATRTSVPPAATSTPVPGSKVVSFTLINAVTDKAVRTLGNGDVINLATLGTNKINIRANTSPATVASVVFGLDGNATYRIESGAPYTLAGDGNNGTNYYAWIPSNGQHTLSATPRQYANGTGTAGTALTITFTVTNSTLAPVAAMDNNPVINGAFEQRVEANNRQVTTWKSNEQGRVKCLSDSRKPTSKAIIPAGDCAYLMNSGAKLSQTLSVSNLNVGSPLLLSAHVQGNQLEWGGKLLVHVIYADGSKQTLRLKLPIGSYASQTFSQSLTLTDTPAKVKLQISYTGKQGWFVIDNVSLMTITDSDMIRRASGNSGEILPVPETSSLNRRK